MSRCRSPIVNAVEEPLGDVAYAFVILAPDDEGRLASGSELEPRPRQNVILELGYFMGRIGRRRVAGIVDGEMELPSDFGGVAYIPYDKNDGWKTKVIRELNAVGVGVRSDRI